MHEGGGDTVGEHGGATGRWASDRFVRRALRDWPADLHHLVEPLRRCARNWARHYHGDRAVSRELPLQRYVLWVTPVLDLLQDRGICQAAYVPLLEELLRAAARERCVPCIPSLKEATVAKIRTRISRTLGHPSLRVAAIKANDTLASDIPDDFEEAMLRLREAIFQPQRRDIHAEDQVSGDPGAVAEHKSAQVAARRQRPVPADDGAASRMPAKISTQRKPRSSDGGAARTNGGAESDAAPTKTRSRSRRPVVPASMIPPQSSADLASEQQERMPVSQPAIARELSTATGLVDAVRHLVGGPVESVTEPVQAPRQAGVPTLSRIKPSGAWQKEKDDGR